MLPEVILYNIKYMYTKKYMHTYINVIKRMYTYTHMRTYTHLYINVGIECDGLRYYRYFLSTYRIHYQLMYILIN